MKKTLALLLLACPALFAQQPPAAPATETAEKAPLPAKETARDQISTTQHTVTVGGQAIAYTARAGTMVLKDEDGTPRANCRHRPRCVRSRACLP